MRRIGRYLVLGTVTLAFVGCGENIEQGMPQNVDMSKDYSPKIDMPGATVKDAQKAAKAAKAKPAPEGAPVK